MDNREGEPNPTFETESSLREKNGFCLRTGAGDDLDSRLGADVLHQLQLSVQPMRRVFHYGAPAVLLEQGHVVLHCPVRILVVEVHVVSAGVSARSQPREI